MPGATVTNHANALQTFNARLSHYALPIVLAMLGYLAQANYTAIKQQLDRIEARQQSDNITIAELKLRVLHLEQLTGNNAAPAVRRAPLTPSE